MPCTYTGSMEGDRVLSLKESLDRRERMLCALVKVLDRYMDEGELKRTMKMAEEGQSGLEVGDIWDWWQQHQAADART